MKKTKILFFIAILFALVSISAVCATSDFNDTDIQTLETNADEIITTDEHATGEGYINFESNAVTIEQGKQNEKNITGTLYYSEGEYIWQDVNLNCNYTDGNGVERSYATTIKDAELNFDLSQCEGLMASDTPYKLTFSPIQDGYYEYFLSYNNYEKLADSYVLLTVTEAQAPANNIYVSPDGTDEEGFGGQSNPYKTIAYAVSQAQANDIIYINEGRYNENSIALNKTLSFIGLNRNVVIYSDKTASGQRIFQDSNKGADSYKFVNLTFESVSFGSNGVIFDLQNTGVNEITNCTFNELTLLRMINSLASENKISNCEFNNIGINQAMTGSALYLGGAASIKDTTFTNSLNKATMSYVNLIQTAASTKLDVDNLTVDGTTGKYNLFYVNQNTQTTIKNSKIINNNIQSQAATIGGMLFSATGTNVTFNVTQSLIANNTPQNGFFYGISNTMTFNMNNNIIYNNTGKIMVNANPIYNIDCNYWGINDKPADVNINNWVIVETSHTPDTAINNEEFTVTATLKVNDSEGNIHELEKPIAEVPVTFEYNNQKLNKVIADKSAEAKFTFNKAAEDILVTVINEKLTDRIAEKEFRIYVSPTGTDAEGCGTKDKPYKTIKYAVSKAEPNFTIYLSEGRYDENSIVLTNNITILGENKNVIITSTMDNRKVFESQYKENGNNISLRFENLTFDTIKPGQYNAVLNLRSEGKTEIINCTFVNTDGQYNIWSSSPDTLIENCEFKNIVFTSSGNLIYLTGKGTPRIINTTFNKISSTANGVVSLIYIINRPTTATVDNLTVSEVSGKFYGINMNNNGNGDINSSIAITNSRFENNEFEKTSSNNQGGSLFMASGASKVEIANATIVNNTVARGIFAGTSNETTINANYNSIYNNTADIIFSVGKPVTYDMDYNYWGSEDPDLGDLNVHFIAIDEDFSEMKTIKSLIDPTMIVEVKTTIEEGENLTINVTITDEGIGGTITVTGIDGVEPQTLKGGKATFIIENLKANQYPITVKYSGSYDYNPAEYETTITVKAPKSVIPGGEDALNMTSPEGSDTPTFSINIPGATGNLTVTVDGNKSYMSRLDENGSANVTVPKLSPGKHNITITYSGDDRYFGISKNVTINVAENATPVDPVNPVNPVTPATPAQPTKDATKIIAKNKKFKAKKKVKKYTITLKAGKKPVKKVQITIKIGKKTYKAKTNAKGKAVFKIKKLTKKGKYKAVIKFKGNKNYKATSKKVKITIK